jgi:putative flippase GtrA
VLFVLLRGWAPALVANSLALLVTAVLNTAANRRFTFGVRGASGRLRHQAQGLAVFLAGLLLTNGCLVLLRGTGATGRWTEITVLTAANLAVTVGRFVVLRWIFRRPAYATGG